MNIVKNIIEIIKNYIFIYKKEGKFALFLYIFLCIFISIGIIVNLLFILCIIYVFIFNLSNQTSTISTMNDKYIIPTIATMQINDTVFATQKCVVLDTKKNIFLNIFDSCQVYNSPNQTTVMSITKTTQGFVVNYFCENCDIKWTPKDITSYEREFPVFQFNVHQ